MMSLVISVGVLIEAGSTLKPQQAAAQRALAKGHSKKIWVLDSIDALHKGQEVSI